MSDKKIIVVTGATGAQGGSLAKAILDDHNSDFSVRAITRNSNSVKAKKLAEMGAEVFQADLDDYDSIKNAFEGAYGAFCVTFFWQHFSAEKELSQAKAMADAARATGLKHVIWSTLEDTRQWSPLTDPTIPILQEKYKVAHFDAKGEADQFFKANNLPSTLMRTSFYWDNFIYFGLEPRKNEEGKYVIVFPMGDKKLPGIAADDIGKCAYGIFKDPGEYIGETIGIAGGFLTGNQMADSLSKALGIDVHYVDVDPDVYRNFGFPGAEDMGNMFQVKRDFEKEYCANRDIKLSRKLNPELQSFETWLEKNHSNIPIV